MKRDGVGSAVSQFCSRLLQNQEGAGMVGGRGCVGVTLWLYPTAITLLSGQVGISSARR